MIAVLTRNQADLFRLLLRLTEGGTKPFDKPLQHQRGASTATGGTLASLVAERLVSAKTVSRGRPRVIRVLVKPDLIVDVDDAWTKAGVKRDLKALLDRGMDEASAYAQIVQGMALESEIDEAPIELRSSTIRDNGKFTKAFKRAFPNGGSYGCQAAANRVETDDGDEEKREEAGEDEGREGVFCPAA